MTRSAGGAAGVVLVGGRSSRMGTPKANLDWHGSTLLYRTTALLGRCVDGPVVAVAAPDQELPDLPPEVEVVRDPAEGRGPLQGIAAGLNAVADLVPVAFVCSTDMPFLHPAYIARVLTCLADAEVALPHVRGFRQPLAAAYRTQLGTRAGELIAAGARKPGELFAITKVRDVTESDLLADRGVATHDATLQSVRNLNTGEEYAAARAEPPPLVSVHVYGALLQSARQRGGQVAAATVGAAAETLGLELGLHVVAALNGERISKDPQFPLVAGDSLAFLAADAGG